MATASKKATLPAPTTAACCPPAAAGDPAAVVRRESTSAAAAAEWNVASAAAEDQKTKKAAAVASLIRSEAPTNASTKGLFLSHFANMMIKVILQCYIFRLFLIFLL